VAGPDKSVTTEPSVAPDTGLAAPPHRGDAMPPEGISPVGELTDEERAFLDFLADTAVGILKERLARGESPDLDFDSRASSSGRDRNDV
jgi:hypothetical protein